MKYRTNENDDIVDFISKVYSENYISLSYKSIFYTIRIHPHDHWWICLNIFFIDCRMAISVDRKMAKLPTSSWRRIDHYKPNCVAEDDCEVDKPFLGMKFKLIIYEFDWLNEKHSTTMIRKT